MATILVVDDHPVNRQLLVAMLRHDGHEIREAGDGRAALQMALRQRPDLIITDIVMPSGDGYELIWALRRQPDLAGLPIIVYTATYNTREAAALASACGVRHIITKPTDPDIILDTVRGMLGEAPPHHPFQPGAAPPITRPSAPMPDKEDADNAYQHLLSQKLAQTTEELHRMENHLRVMQQGSHDGLTGLPRRALFLTRLRQSLHAAQKEGRRVYVAVGNIRNFSSINTSFGRHSGDQVLREVARILTDRSRTPDRLARVSGDEFATFLTDVGTPSEAAQRIHEALETGLAAPLRIDAAKVLLAVQVGVSVAPEDGTDPETLLARAEAAVRRARDTGARIAFFEPGMHRQAAERLDLLVRLSNALEANEFRLRYQVKTSLRTGRITGVEALLTWRGADGIVMPPSRFIPLLEESGQIVEVGNFVVRTALADQARWAHLGHGVVPVAVNVSAVQLAEADFVPHLLDLMAAAPPLPGGQRPRLELEVTETTAMRDMAGTAKSLTILRDRGLTISVDDFGTGYSSLSYLAQLPVSALKIDISFIATMLERRDSRSIVEAIISLAHALDLKVVAEGVETQEQAAVLRALSCDEVQGFLFGRPVWAQDIPAALATPAVPDPAE
ncbi:putative bifunctional diguanylate cyclase/phosphodiesterase [Aquabacter cavernae]|uniref:putative bifunctional diguanylate cyclase/phosphodiesterase n=1 Tax=Aquabacter cavernae TaxID=2496029 RepID=UPI0013DF5EF6|nr:EAL domain-containing response regulator [Aquabacter cavernae]